MQLTSIFDSPLLPAELKTSRTYKYGGGGGGLI